MLNTSPYAPASDLTAEKAANISQVKTRRTIKKFIFYLSLGCLLSYTICFPILPVLSFFQLSRLQPGMPKEVVELHIGSPTRVVDSTTWEYEKAFRFGYVQILFNKDGELVGYNDESVIPIHGGF